MRGNLINYPSDCGTPTADLITVKLMFNSIILTLNAKFMTIDIKDFYLMTPMDCFEYFRMKLELFPQDIIEEYGLHDKVDAYGNVFCKVQQGMYCLPPPSSRNHHTRAPHQMTTPSRIPPKYSNTWILVPQMASNQFHSGRRRFRSEIHQQNRRGPPHQCAQPGLRNRHGLGRNTISRTHIGLGLQIKEGTPFHAGIHRESLHQIWPHNVR